MNDDYLTKLINQVFDKNNDLKTHSLNVAFYMKAFGESLNFSKNEIEKLELIGLLHDLGKIYISNNILLKTGNLTNDEYDIIKRHPYLGYKLLKNYPDIYPSVLCHHERYGGGGYPYNCNGSNIPFFARMTSVCDSFDAMTEKRSYNKPISYDDALKQLVANSSTQFDPFVVNAFCNIFDSKIRKLK